MVRENIINVFGSKQISTLIDIDLMPPNEEVLTEFGIKSSSDSSVPFSFEFLISSVIHGSGRRVADRQFYFINSRPCEPSKLMKIVNEIYKQFNSNEYPFVYLNVTTKSALIDVNITPDKRQVFIENEKLLLAVVKSSLLSAFKQFPSTFKMQNVEITNFIQRDRGIKRSITESCIQKGSILEIFKKKPKTTGNSSTNKIDIKDFLNKPKETFNNGPTDNFDQIKIDKSILDESQEKLDSLIEMACQLIKDDKDNDNVIDVESAKFKPEDLEISLDQPKFKKLLKSVPFKISIEQIKKCNDASKEGVDESIKIRFRSEIKTDQNKSAEEELQKQIKKSDFSEMTVIGQFNKGFIVTKLKDDLFLIDQHASDEKYNFEMLQLNTVVDSQVLVK